MVTRRLLVELALLPRRRPLAAVVIVASAAISTVILLSSRWDADRLKEGVPSLSPVNGFAGRRLGDVPEDLLLPPGGAAWQKSRTAESGSGSTGALLRILVLTFRRERSLARCLASLNAAHYDGERVLLEIHVDRSPDGKVHNETLHTANAFVFKHGPVQVHVKPRHGGVVGQWLNTWRLPSDNSSEIAVFVEDDLTLSPFFARWLRRVHGKYDSYPAINGYALQGESIRHGVGSKPGNLQGPPGHCAFLYPILGSWGFSPKLGPWKDFIRMYREASADPTFIPQVPGLLPSVWYRSLHQQGRAETMWTMWHIYHAYQNHLYTVYPHLPDRQGLAFNWKEPGEHYSKQTKVLRAQLLDTWREEDVRLPEKLVILDAKGENTGHTLSPAGIE